MDDMDRSVREFNLALRDFVRKTCPDQVVTVQRKISLDALKRLVEKTPVRTGRARGNWQVGIDQRPETQDVLRYDQSGGPTIRKGAAVIKGMQKPCVCYLTNNVDYINDLEDGKSTQAPNGMMAVTVQELREML